MKIVLNGIETNNKGAELMLYAILQEIERKHPDAEVILPYQATQKNLAYLHTPLCIKNIPYARLRQILFKLKIAGIMRRLRLNIACLTENYLLKEVDYFIDASGFSISDQWKPNRNTIHLWQYRCQKFGMGKSKMILLPQAFGPAEMPETRTILQNLSAAATCIMPREEVSENWLLRSGVDPAKIRRHSDFTILVEGIFPTKYLHLKGGICIIPNARMIDKGILSKDSYLSLLEDIIRCCQETGHIVYLLNHEGPEDARLATQCAQRVKNMEVVTGLNALEVKGLIATAYVCISSRFHGVVSSLNACVPCLSTSWSHKYAELYKDYRLNDCVLHLKDPVSIKAKIRETCQPETHAQMRTHLAAQKNRLTADTQTMWEEVWSV